MPQKYKTIKEELEAPRPWLPFRPDNPVYRVIFRNVLNYSSMIEQVGRVVDHHYHHGDVDSLSSFAYKIELGERKSKRV